MRRRMRKEIRGPPTSLSPPVTNTVPASTMLDRQSLFAKIGKKERGGGGEEGSRRRDEEEEDEG